MAIVLDGVGTVNGVLLPTTGFGKVLQVVRATDATARSTSSLSFVDASLSVTITPQKSTSAILLMYTGYVEVRASSGASIGGQFQITDNSNTAISGAQATPIGIYNVSYSAPGINESPFVVIGYATPATLSAVTFKIRFKVEGSTILNLRNNNQTGQMYAIEVSA